MKTNLRISGAIMALTCMTAPAVSEAQETIASPVETDVRISSVSDFVPSRLSKDGLCKLTFTDFDETSGVAKATSVDRELTTVAEINVTAEPECYNYYMECRGKIDFKWDSIERDTIDSYSGEISDFLAKRTGVSFSWHAHYMTADDYSDGEIYMSNDDSSFKMVDGIKVPWWFFIVRHEQLIEVECTGNCTINKILPEDYSKRIWYSTPLLSPAFKDYDNGSHEFGNVTLSQTLFDDNDAFEYISPIYAEAEIESREEVYSESLYDYGSSFACEAFLCESQRSDRIIGFRIMREDGCELQSVYFGDDLYADDYYGDFMSIVLFGGKKYLSCSLDGSTALYEINAASNEVKKVATYKTRVYPTLVNSNQNINIEFGEGSNIEREINISDLSGKKLYSGKANTPTGRTTLPASIMSKGMNIVTVADEDGGSVSTKVIVK